MPEPVLRAGIRADLRAAPARESGEEPRASERRSSRSSARSPIAEQVEEANEQHYEVPADVLRARARPAAQVQLVPTGPTASTTLAEAEEAMLALTCERARGRGRAWTLLDLGCGWGSLTLLAGRALPARADHGGLELAAAARVHRGARALPRTSGRHRRRRTPRARPRASTASVSVEMFEHMRNYERAARPHRALARPGGRAVRARLRHRRFAYPFDAARLDGARVLHRRDSCRRTTCCSRFQGDLRSSSTGASRHALRAHGRGLVANLDANRADSSVLATPTAPAAARWSQLARVLPRVRGAVGLPRRPRVGRRALPLRPALRACQSTGETRFWLTYAGRKPARRMLRYEFDGRPSTRSPVSVTSCFTPASRACWMRAAKTALWPPRRR